MADPANGTVLPRGQQFFADDPLNNVPAPLCLELALDVAVAASEIAQTDVECFRLDKAGFQEVLRRRPDIARNVAAVLSATVPAASVPMKFPWTRFPLDP
jgi:hypothetical protein